MSTAMKSDEVVQKAFDAITSKLAKLDCLEATDGSLSRLEQQQQDQQPALAMEAQNQQIIPHIADGAWAPLPMATMRIGHPNFMNWTFQTTSGRGGHVFEVPRNSCKATQASTLISAHIFSSCDSASVMDALLPDFVHIFSEPQGPPHQRHCDHCIHLLPGTTWQYHWRMPQYSREYAQPYLELQKEELENQCRDMLAMGSSSAFSSPVLPPWMSFAMNSTAPNTSSSSICTRGTTKVHVHEDDIAKTAFRTHDGLYEFLVMSFGLSNALAPRL
ncbi:hypothetical protein U9M48_036093 [Paspalum notatum var. saurae]|uniref:Uncharacterized protein n=1 Tax=Paspalum notatum var. saurae TaxID=547442 RepID=A0AAQ3X8K4_PASNO